MRIQLLSQKAAESARAKARARANKKAQMLYAFEYLINLRIGMGERQEKLVEAQTGLLLTLNRRSMSFAVTQVTLATSQLPR